MSYKEWGNTVWYMFHGLSHKLKPEYEATTLLGPGV